MSCFSCETSHSRCICGCGVVVPLQESLTSWVSMEPSWGFRDVERSPRDGIVQPLLHTVPPFGFSEHLFCWDQGASEIPAASSSNLQWDQDVTTLHWHEKAVCFLVPRVTSSSSLPHVLCLQDSMPFTWACHPEPFFHNLVRNSDQIYAQSCFPDSWLLSSDKEVSPLDLLGRTVSACLQGIQKCHTYQLAVGRGVA